MRIYPFRAYRPPAEMAADVASVPYDVVTTEEARELAEGKPWSFLHVVRPEIDLPEGTDIYAEEVYAKGKENLDRLLGGLPFEQDVEGCFYVYRLMMEGRDQVGVVCCLDVDDYDNDLIKKHERTRRAKEDDRTRHVVTLGFQAEPIFLAYRDEAMVQDVVREIMAGKPLYDFAAEDGVSHTVWRVADEIHLTRLLSAFDAVPCLYVADGHHRAKSASRARAHYRDRTPDHSGDEEYNRVMAVIFPDSMLKILPYHRLVLDLGSRQPATLMEELVSRFGPLRIASPVPDAPDSVRVGLGGAAGVRWYDLHLPPLDGGGVIGSLPATRLQEQVLAPMLGIEDPRTDRRIDFVGGIRGTGELERRLLSGDAKIAFSLYPTGMEELFAVADAGDVMPPKSTWFEPKLRSGLFLHKIA